jgi:RNA polymerase sigma-70 factor (ECF subfamily)
MADRRRADRRREALVARLTGAVRTAPTLVDPDLPGQLDLRGSIGIALGLLRPADREILILVAWEGFTVEQLAVALDCSKATASVRLHRARRRFSTLLAAADGEESQVDEPKTRGALLPSMGET